MAQNLYAKKSAGLPSAYATARQPAAAEGIVFDGSGTDCSAARRFRGIKTQRRGSAHYSIAAASTRTKNHLGTARSRARVGLTPGRRASFSSACGARQYSFDGGANFKS